VARRLGVDVIDRFAPGDEGPLAAELAARPGVSLVSWHHKSLSKIVDALGDVTPTPPPQWPADRYDLVWVLVRDGDRWRFTQVPQLLLPGDQEEPVAA
jgi:hypothetical protein